MPRQNTISRREIEERTGMTSESISIALASTPIISRTGSYVYNTTQAIEALERYMLSKREHWMGLIKKYDQQIERIREMRLD